MIAPLRRPGAVGRRIGRLQTDHIEGQLELPFGPPEIDPTAFALARIERERTAAAGPPQATPGERNAPGLFRRLLHRLHRKTKDHS